MKSRVTNSEVVQSDTFTLTFPEPFKIEPAYVVDLPRGWKAQVFEVANIHVFSDGAEGKPPVKGWRVVVRMKSGALSRNHNYSSGNAYFRDPLNIRLYIENLAIELAKKATTKATTVEIEDVE